MHFEPEIFPNTLGDNAFDQIPLVPLGNIETPFNLPLNDHRPPIFSDFPSSPIMSEMPEALFENHGNASSRLNDAAPLESIFKDPHSREPGKIFAKLGNIFNRFLSKSPNNTVNVIKIKRDVDLSTGEVKTKVDENVFQMQPDGHLKKLFRMRFSTLPNHLGAGPVNTHHSKLLMDDKPEPLNLHSFTANHNLNSAHKLHPIHSTIHKASATHHPLHSAHNRTYAPHRSAARTFGLSVAMFFLSFVLIYAALKIYNFVKRKRETKEYFSLYSRGNDSVANTASFNVNQELSTV